MGDPAGIGPELCLRLLHEPAVRMLCEPMIYGSAALLEAVARECGPALEPGAPVVDCAGDEAAAVAPGVPTAAGGRVACACIRAALQAVLEGRADALVTAPISKAALRLAGVAFPGHTEMLAHLTGARRYAMMFAAEGLVVSLATIHVPYARVPDTLSTAGILDVIELTAEALRRLGTASPRLAVCGLNPHAGEGGLFGREEQEIILPAVRAARERGFSVSGPLPPDTAFLPEARRRADAIVAMYHDQGLIPFKMLAFDRGVNVTLGLPIVRTSPDHGTAFDIARQGSASPGSMREAVRWAVRLAAGSRKS
ncbi:MAG: 4-hydroxythreonine-4-phosphate dehydrogenase PdxA [Lentisphaerae bacterium]|nr:4-hydroxythreonine-4-phosphate dehydrogenase PdxA [Lentisphaerota bacterium]